MANLIGDGGKAFPDAGIFALQKRQDLPPHPVAGKAERGVGPIHPELEAVEPCVVQNLGFSQAQKRADQRHAGRQGPLGKNSGQGFETAPAQQAQHHAFGLIVQVVRGGGLAAAQAPGLPGQSPVAQLAPGLLEPQTPARGGLGDGKANNARRHAPDPAQFQNEARVRVGGAPAQAVMKMNEMQIETPAAAQRPEIMPQADRIRPSRNRGENAISGGEKSALLLQAPDLRPYSRREGLFSHARIVSNCLLGLFLALGPLAAPAFAAGVAKSTATAKPRPAVAKSSAPAVGVAVSTNAAQAAAYARQAQAEFGRREYWSAWRDAENALRLGSQDPAVAALKVRAWTSAMAEENVAASTATAKAVLKKRAPSSAAAAKPAAGPPSAGAAAGAGSFLRGRAIRKRPLAALGLGGLLLLVLLIALIPKSSSKSKPRRDPGQGHVPASEIPPTAPLPRAGAVLGGRFILGSLKEETDGVCVYDGRDLHDESMTIVRYPGVPGALERARKAVDFKHPSVALLRGVFPYGVHIFAAYESLRGDSLRQTLERLPERRYSPEQALRLLKNLCEALDAAHALGFCHGPLAPGEIIIGSSQVKMRGFGLWPVAALAYAAPEFSLEQGDSTPASDLFSLAACLYEMLTGKTAFFESRDPAGSALFAPPSQNVPELGPAMDGLFAKALAAEPEKRFPSATDLFAAFSRLVVSKPASGKDGKKS